MAAPVEFRTYTPTDSRADLVRRIEAAPREHAEAILEAYNLLEQLHEKDVLNLLTGLLKARDTVVNSVTDAASSPEAVTTLRLLLMLGNSLKSVDADRLDAVLNRTGDPPSLFAIAKQMASKDSRRALGVLSGALNVFGAALGKDRK